jgi:uncharacterized membrane protein (UPF0127 family)
MALRSCRSGTLLADVVEGAFDSRARRQGLLGRSRLPDGSALAIAPCSAIHTCFMRFSIDVVFVRRGGEVVRVAEDVRPWRIRVAWGAHAVVELPAGTARRTGLRAGDRVELVQPTPA